MTAAQPTIVATSIGFTGTPGNPGDIAAGPAYQHAARLALRTDRRKDGPQCTACGVYQ